MSNPSHIEVILTEKEAPVKKPEAEGEDKKKKVSKKKKARENLRDQQRQQ